MKEVTDGLIKNYYKRKTDKTMRLRDRMRHWYKEDVRPFRALILNAFVVSLIGGASGALIVLIVYVLGR